MVTQVWTLEVVYEVEEDFGGFQEHCDLYGVYATQAEALDSWNLNRKGYDDCVIKSWSV